MARLTAAGERGWSQGGGRATSPGYPANLKACTTAGLCDLVQRNFLGFEPVELPAGIEQRPLDHRVPLERGQRVVEPLDRGAHRIPVGRYAQFVFAVLTGERQLADHRLVVAAKGPAKHADVTIVLPAAIDRRRIGVDARDRGQVTHAAAVLQMMRQSRSVSVCSGWCYRLAGESSADAARSRAAADRATCSSRARRMPLASASAPPGR